MSVEKGEGAEPRRRLATVLSADIEGFSRLCAEAEAETLAMLDRHMKDVVAPTVRQHRGRVANIAGDGIIAEFGSAVAAVKAALAIQRTVDERNVDVPPTRRLRFRIGLNLSEVVVKQRQIFGDGVNIAARAQTFANAGAVCATEAVVQQVRGKIEAEYADLGLVRMKNISEPIHLFRIAEHAIGEPEPPAAPASAASPTSSKPSIAVLPFVNLSGDPDQSYFSDGITEDLITDLSRFRTISVIARNSSFVYRGRSVDVNQVANDLGVRFVVEGSIRKLQDSARITAQLVNAETRHHVWANRYDVLLSDLFRTQDEIMRQIIGHLVPRIEVESLHLARRQPTELLQAYDYYLRGKAALYAATDAKGTAEAKDYFERAITVDPDFAYPYAYLTRIYNNLTMYASPGQTIAPFREKAWQFALRAISLDDADPHSHVGIAWCQLWRGDFRSAAEHLETAERLNPNDPDRAMDCGTGWMYLGDVDRAIASMQTGLRLNPNHPVSYLGDLAEAYFVARRYDEMLELLERIPDQSPRTAAWKAAAYALSGKQDRAAKEAAKFVQNLRTLWAGDPAAGIEEYVEWLISFSPFARAEDRGHFLEGLRLAGLRPSARS